MTLRLRPTVAMAPTVREEGLLFFDIPLYTRPLGLVLDRVCFFFLRVVIVRPRKRAAMSHVSMQRGFGEEEKVEAVLAHCRDMHGCGAMQLSEARICLSLRCEGERNMTQK